MVAASPLAIASSAWAHSATATGGWDPDAWIVAGALLSAAALYVRGWARLGAFRDQALPLRYLAAFAAGWAALWVALLSPLDDWGKALFSAHMAQHEMIMLVAAPLLVAGRFAGVATWAFRSGRKGLPAVIGRALGRNRAWRILAAAPGAWTLHLLVVWLWHAPRLFQASLANEWIHGVQHSTFLFSALLFWWALQKRARNGWAALYVLTTAIHTGVLGALLTFAPHPLYPAYLHTTGAWGMSPLEDQQLGGLIMWVPAGLVLLGIAMWQFAQWLPTAGSGVDGARARARSS